MPSDAPSDTPDSSESPRRLPEPSRIAITTADGLILRAESFVPAQPCGNVVLCHPHPLHGGNMFASVIDSLFRTLCAQGFACIRFNFRGVTGSDGRHDYGNGEQLDVIAAIDYLVELHPDLPLTLAGWSFGADVSLGVCHPAVSQWFCVAPPLGVLEAKQMGACADPRPIHLAIPEHDQFNDPASVAQRIADWDNATVTVIPGTDHFLQGRLGLITELASEVLPRI